MSILQFCESNVKHEGMEDLVEKCRTDFKNTKVSIEPCLGECGDCAELYIAMVNDSLVTGDTTHALYDEIESRL